MGIGVVVRDEKGTVIVAASKMRQGLFEPVTGEAYASFHAASICREMGIRKVWLEGNAKIIVTRCILQAFPSWKCGFVHLEANEVAHRLAKVANVHISDKMWRDHTPYCISNIILMEQTTLSF
jgi:hypothetical protein